MTLSDSLELTKFLASFVLLIILIYVLYYYLSNFQNKFQKNGNLIKIKETKMIGKNRFLHIVEIEEEEILIASDEQGVKILKEWRKKDKIE